MTTALQSCMGGNCARRDSCCNYLAASVHAIPVERICEPGHDGVARMFVAPAAHEPMRSPWAAMEAA